MATVTRIILKDINIELLGEELLAAGLGGLGIVYVGFIRQDTGLHVPKATRSAHATSTVGGVTTEFLSDPGELFFKTDTDPGAPLDAVLAAHDATGRSVGQAAQDQEDADKLLLQTELEKPGALNQAALRASARLALRV